MQSTLAQRKASKGRLECIGCPEGPFTCNACPATVHLMPQKPAIPLAGDVVAALGSKFGADRVAKLIQKVSGRPCACPERRARLNRFTQWATERLGL